MNPLAALLLPLSALVVAGTTVSAVTADPAGAATPAVAADRAMVHRTAGAPSAAGDRFGPPTGAAVARPVTGPAGPSTGAVAPPVTGPEVGPGLRARWSWPLQPQPPVVRPFLRPATRYGAGHRGVDLAGTAGQDVLAVEAGTVTHVGRIAGRGTVTVLHASGVRSTYEPVTAAVRTGEAVPRGAALGRLEPAGSHCGSAPCLHLGAIRDADYLDPLVFLLGGRRVRLLPLAQAPDG